MNETPPTHLTDYVIFVCRFWLSSLFFGIVFCKSVYSIWRIQRHRFHRQPEAKAFSTYARITFMSLFDVFVVFRRQKIFAVIFMRLDFFDTMLSSVKSVSKKNIWRRNFMWNVYEYESWKPHQSLWISSIWESKIDRFPCHHRSLARKLAYKKERTETSNEAHGWNSEWTRKTATNFSNDRINA